MRFPQARELAGFAAQLIQHYNHRLPDYLSETFEHKILPSFRILLYWFGLGIRQYDFVFGLRFGRYREANDLPHLNERLLRVTDEYGRTGMHYAAQNNTTLSIIVAAQFCDLQARDRMGISPIDILIESGQISALLTILDNSRADRTLFSLTPAQFFKVFSPLHPAPELEESLQGLLRIDELPNAAIDQFSNSLSTYCASFPQRYLQTGAYQRLAQCNLLLCEVTTRPITRSMLVQSLKYYDTMIGYIDWIVSIFAEPKFIVLMRQWATSLEVGGRLTFEDQGKLFEEIKKYCYAIQKRQQNISSAPDKVVNRIVLALLPFLKKAGYPIDNLLPESLKNIGPLYKDIDDIPSHQLHFLYVPSDPSVSSSSRPRYVPFDLEDCLKDMIESLTFRNPLTHTPLNEKQIREILKFPRAQEILKQVHKLYQKKHQNQISDKFLDLLEQLGVKLHANGGDFFNETRATRDLQEFLMIAHLYKDDIEELNKIRVYVPHRCARTTYADIFNNVQFSGCTQYLGPSIKEYVTEIRALISLRLNSSPVERYFALLPMDKSVSLSVIPPEEDLDGRSMSTALSREAQLRH